MITPLTIEEFLTQSAGHLVIDVRSEGEYNYGHILYAVNLPLFNNEERKIIGTLYKQKGRNDAIKAGLDIVGPKMSGFVKFVEPLAKDNKVFVHCWRGGMRSGSMAWLIHQFGYNVYTLKGGYKSYRHFVLEKLAVSYKLIILGGKTGTGKTEILKALKQAGEQVIDLEQLANHKGSAFGGIGQPAQPSSEHFENLLADELIQLDSAKRIWLEDESKSIGRVFLNTSLWQNMCAAPLFVIERPLQLRLKRLHNEYAGHESEALKIALTNIKTRLGPEQWKNAITALEEKDFTRVAEIALHYYDKAYDRSVVLKEKKEINRFTFETETVEEIAAALIKTANEKY